MNPDRAASLGRAYVFRVLGFEFRTRSLPGFVPKQREPRFLDRTARFGRYHLRTEPPVFRRPLASLPRCFDLSGDLDSHAPRLTSPDSHLTNSRPRAFGTMPSEPGSGSTRGNASSPSGDADADEKAAKLRERVRERLKARQAFALSGGPGTAAGDVTTVKHDRETLFTGDPCLDSDAKRRKTDTTTTSGGQTGNTTIHSNQPDSDQLTDPETNARRSRVEAWRAGRKGKMLLGADTDKDENGVDANGWNLEDESDDEAPATASGPADDDEEEDPLDAFMAANDGVMDFERESAAARQVEKETQATQKKLEKDRVEKELETAAQFAAAAARAAR